jgi:hypothetical protein
MAISFTVPLIARSPIFPPGKKMGSTVYESVEKASRLPASSKMAHVFGEAVGNLAAAAVIQ